jgi:hypothetical protein
MKELGYTTKIISQAWYRNLPFLKEQRDASHFDQNRWFIAHK